jgi:hypothetical protein
VHVLRGLGPSHGIGKACSCNVGVEGVMRGNAWLVRQDEAARSFRRYRACSCCEAALDIVDTRTLAQDIKHTAARLNVPSQQKLSPHRLAR